MRWLRGGIIKELSIDSQNGKIIYYQEKREYMFTKESLVGVLFDELSEGDCVDFCEYSYKKASIVQRTALEWSQGIICNQTLPIKYKVPWCQMLVKQESRKPRDFWAPLDRLCLGENALELHIGDKVRFQWPGSRNNSSNRAFLFTKKHLGYITEYERENETGEIDFKYKFSLTSINNIAEYSLDTEKYFYYISYDIDSISGNEASNINIIKETTEILFDQSGKWFDGIVKKIDFRSTRGKYLIVHSIDNPKNTFMADSKCIWRTGNINLIEEGQRISFSIDNNDPMRAKDVAWLGYICRYPLKQTDGSGWINPKDLNDENKLLYFRKAAIFGVNKQDQGKYKYINVAVGGEHKEIPIQTDPNLRYNLRYKVRFIKTEDNERNGEYMAVGIEVIGIVKPCINAEIVEEKNKIINDFVIEEKDRDRGPLTVNCYVMGNAHIVTSQHNTHINPNINIISINNFLESIKNNFLVEYIEKVNKQLQDSAETFLGVDDDKSDVKSSELANRFFPIEELTEESEKTLEGEFDKARIIHREITDEMLDELSVECKSYVMAAVIVENSLREQKELIRLGDFSAQMVMYGKALEQSLRDTFFLLIKDNNDLYTCEILNKKAFSDIGVENSTIGNYQTLIENKKVSLVELCYSRQNSVHCLECPKWELWWDRLKNNIDEVRRIRNESAHAGQKVAQDKSLRMTDLLFSEGGIFKSLQQIKLISKIKEKYYNFLGKYIYNNRLIVGCLASREKAALHICNVKDNYTNPEELQEIFDKCKDGRSIKVKIIGETEKGLNVSLKGVPEDINNIE